MIACAGRQSAARRTGTQRRATHACGDLEGMTGGFLMTDVAMTARAEAEAPDAAECFARGMIHSAGAGVPVDLVEAHKWFNIAALRGHAEAARLRREIAEFMSDAEIGRAWLAAHPQPPTERSHRVAA